ncbi:MAG: hypothetical protein ACM3OF_07775 [Gemmatimonas sp.]
MLYPQILAGNPQLEVNVQHVLLKRGGIAADANQEPSFGRFCDEGMQRLGIAIVVEGRRGGEVQRLECLFGSEFSRSPVCASPSYLTCRGNRKVRKIDPPYRKSLPAFA